MVKVPHVRIAKSLLANPSLSITAKLLYAVLLDRRNKTTGQCNPSRQRLADDLGTNLYAVKRALRQLYAAGLIQSEQGQRTNSYTFEVAQCEPPENPGGSSTGHHAAQYEPPEPAASLLTEPTQVNLSSQSVNGTGAEGGWLAGLLREVWGHLPGGPGPSLVSQIEAMLDGIPPDEFARLLVARRAKARSFGLALELARELRQRYDAEAAERQRAAAAETERQIQACEEILADPATSAEDRATFQQYLAELRGKSPPPKKAAASAGSYRTGEEYAARR